MPAGSARAAGGSLDRILERGQLVVGMEIGYYPFEYLDFNGNPVGFDVEFAELIARHLNVKLRIKDLEWRKLIPALDAGKIDCIVSAMTRTRERSELVDFTDPYFQTGLCALLSREKAPGLKDIGRLNDPGRLIAFIKDSDGAVAAQRFFPSAEVQPVSSESDGVRAVLGGFVDAFILDQISIWKRHKDYPDKTYAILKPFTLEYFSVATPKNDTGLLNWLNRFLKDIRSNGMYEDLYQKYFSDIGPSFSQ